ncbi:MAG: hypothetical protein JW912_03205 [Sedimentisphaerales bacterium]|nr:hypothetical protein [Sedimentisphaerales bacterium]
MTEVLQVGYYADKEDWQSLLEYVERHPGSQHNKFCNYDINRALYYTGRFGDEMFSYYQSPPALLLPTSLGSTSSNDSTGSPEVMYRYIRKVDLFMELGYLGTAKRYASEGLETGNGCPHMTKKLALICLAEEQNETAKVYLGALSKDLVYGRFARQLLQRLDRDPQLTDYEPVQRLRSIAFKRDYIGSYKMEHFFSQLLWRNPHNKMAFEYMMASYLLTGQVNKIAENISRLHEFGYKKIPRHYQEALLIYTDSQPQRGSGEKINLEGLSVSSEATQCYQNFIKEAMPLYMRKRDRRMTRQYLAKDFGNTYMFYMCEELPRFKNLKNFQGLVND